MILVCVLRSFGEQSLDGRSLRRQLKLIGKYLSERHLTGAVIVVVGFCLPSSVWQDDQFRVSKIGPEEKRSQRLIKGVMKNGLASAVSVDRRKCEIDAEQRQKNIRATKRNEVDSHTRVIAYALWLHCTEEMSALLEGMRCGCRRRHRSWVMVSIYCRFIASCVRPRSNEQDRKRHATDRQPEAHTAHSPQNIRHNGRYGGTHYAYNVNERAKSVSITSLHVKRFETFRWLLRMCIRSFW